MIEIKTEKITAIVPCFNEEQVLLLFYAEITKVADAMKEASGVEFEIIFVNDGSTDRTLKLLKEFSELDKRVHYISFSRNFGKEAAMYAGLQNARGDYVAILDADMQDPPTLLPEMYELLKEEQYDCVATRRVDRKGEPPIRSFFARCFYKLINRISDADIMDGARDFRLMKRKMVDAILSMTEYNRFSKGIFGWVGFRTKWLPYVNVQRAAGETKWSFWKLLRYSLEGIIAFSTAPLSIALISGILFCLIAVVLLLWTVIKALVLGSVVSELFVFAGTLLLIGGTIELSIGILGQYLAKTYLETKQRPVYIVSETDPYL